MKKYATDTIVALATPPGRGGIGVVRLSGPLTEKIAQQILGCLPKPRYATFSRFLDNQQTIIDEGLAVYFPNPHSFTGESVLELHGHGGPAVLDMLITRILECGARLAKPGEFSERAFLNDKLDLAQAEAIADLIDASSTQAARSAMRSLQGEFSQLIHRLVEDIIRLRMYVEAAIDFVEEEIDFLADQQVINDLQAAIMKLEAIQANATQGSLLREGVTVVIVGEPNVGKSTLLNCLSGKDIAIVTDIPGTTRDVLRQEISIDGMPLHIIDTAGIRESADLVEQEGIRRAKHEIAQADIILYLVDASKNISGIDAIQALPTKAKAIVVRNKIDLTHESASIKNGDDKAIVSLSAKSNQGIELLKTTIKDIVGYSTTSEGCFSARRRHLDAIKRAMTALLEGQAQLIHHKAGDLLAEELRIAQLALSEITGEFTPDDLLGRIFASFCIGK